MSSKRYPLSHRNRLKIIISLLSLMAVVELINSLTGRSLSHFGIVPRQISGLSGIFLSPFIHGNIWHLISNSVPFAVLGYLLLMHGAIRFLLVNLWVMIVGGGLVWLFGREAIHVGASGLVYGYFAYLLVAGFIAREFKLLLISLFVMMAYGGMIWGVLPSSPYISWEGHLFGAVAGVIAAFIWGKTVKQQ